jgi:hypothetical protein
VLSGVETKQEFLGIHHVRLLVSILLGLSFYLTRILVWGLSVHSLVNTTNYMVPPVLGMKQGSITLEK